MTPILYPADEKTFATMGFGGLPDAIDCKVLEVAKGTFELNMKYPLTGANFEELAGERIILARPAEGRALQPFRIKSITPSINGTVSVYALHVSRDADGTPVKPFEASSLKDALNGLRSNSMTLCPVTLTADFTRSGKYSQQAVAPLFERLGGVEGSIIDVYGGEFEFDRWSIILHQRRGESNGVEVRYGFNMTDCEMTTDFSDVYVGCVAFWADQDTGETVYGAVQYADDALLYPITRIYTYDASADYESKPTAAQLNSRAAKYLNDNSLAEPKVNIKASFVDLSHTDQYADMAPLQQVSLYDTVTVLYPEVGIKATARVTSCEYDVLKEEYSKIELGNYTRSFASALDAFIKVISK